MGDGICGGQRGGRHSHLTLRKGADKPELWLPASKGDVVETDENEILELDVLRAIADFPARVELLFHG